MKMPKNWMVFWHRVAKALLATALLFWICETLFFTIIEGLHWRATHPIEQLCDMVVEMLFVGAMLSLFFSLLYLLDEQVKLAQRQQFVNSEPSAPEAPLEGLKDEDLTGYASYTMSVFKDGEITTIIPNDYSDFWETHYRDDKGQIFRRPESEIVNPKSEIE